MDSTAILNMDTFKMDWQSIVFPVTGSVTPIEALNKLSGYCYPNAEWATAWFWGWALEVRPGPAPPILHPEGAQRRQELKGIPLAQLSQRVPFQQSRCGICKMDYKPAACAVRELPCKHLFHDDCICSWLIQYSSDCPICRESVLSVLNRQPRRTTGVGNAQELNEWATAERPLSFVDSSETLSVNRTIIQVERGQVSAAGQAAGEVGEAGPGEETPRPRRLRDRFSRLRQRVSSVFSRDRQEEGTERREEAETANRA